MAIKLIPIAEIEVCGLIRRPRPSRVAVVARSIKDAGLLAPIEVSPKVGGGYLLTTGWVRLEAVKSLGRNVIQAQVLRATGDKRRWRQISDNLVQDGCTVLDRAIYLADGKILYEAQHPETGHGGARRGDQVAKVGHLKPYFAWAAEQYGIAERSVRRACLIGAAVHRGAAEQLADTGWDDNQAALEALIRFEAAHQLAITKLLTRQPDPVESIAEAIEQVVGRAPNDDGKKRWSAAYSNFSGMAKADRLRWVRQVVDDGLLSPRDLAELAASHKGGR